MKLFSRLLFVASLLIAAPALAQNTVPYIGGTAGLTSGNLVSSGSTVGQLQDSGVPASSVVTGPGSSTVGHLATWNNTGGTGLADSPTTSLNLPTQTGAITTGDCVKWASGTSITDAGAACGSGGGSANPFHPGFQANQYYTSPLVALSSYAVSPNRLYATPFYVPTTTTFTKISVYVATAAASSACELGVYSNSSGAPSTLVQDSGNVAVTSSGASAELTGLSIPLNAGWYWLVVGCNGAPTLEAASGVTTAWFTGLSSQNATTQGQLFGSWTYSVGGLPTSFPAVTYASQAEPLVYLRL